MEIKLKPGEKRRQDEAVEDGGARRASFIIRLPKESSTLEKMGRIVEEEKNDGSCWLGYSQSHYVDCIPMLVVLFTQQIEPYRDIRG